MHARSRKRRIALTILAIVATPIPVVALVGFVLFSRYVHTVTLSSSIG